MLKKRPQKRFTSVMPRLLLTFCLAALLSSCSIGFNREWKAALKKGPQPGVEGAWEGTWQSDVNGHHGQLRSVVDPAKNAEGDHTFHYHATWAGFLTGTFHADHRVKPEKDHLQFQGQHTMPDWAGGLYTYKGTIKGDEFSASYDCALDNGTFQMTRVK